ncbi:PKD domain-containing protein [Halobaculum litoreum]|uniref:PKD domain-containing protein n=1 Tax=Halobaculum litoreum TaxID=3031998 RepID=A0ABD5XUI7_9EURY
MRIASLALVVVLLVSAVTTPVAGHPGPENDPPLADAGLDQTVERGATVWLDGGGSLDPDGEIESYRWAIETPTGDTIDPDDPDAVSTTFVPESVGRYAVTLTVTDDHGVTRNDTLYVEVSSRSGSDPADAPANESPPHANEPPTGGIAGPDTVTSGEPTTFTADVYDPDGDVVSYAWSDGQSGAEVTKTVDIPPGETFAFSVRATDDDGATRTFRKTVEVRAEGGPSGREPTIDPANQQPSVRIVGPDRVATNQSVTYALAGSDPDGRIVRWEWPGRTATGPSIDLAWTTPTTVTLRGVVTDDDGATAVATKTVEVYDEGPPVVDIAGPDTAPVGTTQEYTLEAYDPDGGNLTISWDPSQNQLERVNDRFVNHVGIEGELGETVEVRAIVTDDEGNTVIAVKETEVENSEDAEDTQGVPQLLEDQVGIRSRRSDADG